MKHYARRPRLGIRPWSNGLRTKRLGVTDGGLPRKVAFHGCQTGTLKRDIESGEYPELDPFKDSAALGGAAYRTTARAIERAAQLVSRWWSASQVPNSRRSCSTCATVDGRRLSAI